VEVLKQLDLLNAAQARELEGFGPVKPLTNHRGLVTGESHPVFSLSSHL
jgi:hypothetical protein